MKIPTIAVGALLLLLQLPAAAKTINSPGNEVQMEIGSEWTPVRPGKGYFLEFDHDDGKSGLYFRWASKPLGEPLKTVKQLAGAWGKKVGARYDNFYSDKIPNGTMIFYAQGVYKGSDAILALCECGGRWMRVDGFGTAIDAHVFKILGTIKPGTGKTAAEPDSASEFSEEESEPFGDGVMGTIEKAMDTFMGLGFLLMVAAFFLAPYLVLFLNTPLFSKFIVYGAQRFWRCGIWGFGASSILFILGFMMLAATGSDSGSGSDDGGYGFLVWGGVMGLLHIFGYVVGSAVAASFIFGIDGREHPYRAAAVGIPILVLMGVFPLVFPLAATGVGLVVYVGMGSVINMLLDPTGIKPPTGKEDGPGFHLPD